MKLYKFQESGGLLLQYIAKYDPEHVLVLDYYHNKLDTYNVLEDEDFGDSVEEYISTSAGAE